MNKLNLKELANLDVKDIGQLLKGIKPKEVEINFNEVDKKNKNKKGKQILAIDIGSSYIKLVEGKFEKNIINIDKLLKINTPEGSISDGKIINEDMITDVLKSVIASNDIKAKNVIFTTNSSLIINREIIIPMVKPEEIETVVKYEIQQYLPINLNDYILQYTPIGEVKEADQKKIKLNVTSFPEKMAYSYYKVINDLGLIPLALDVSFNAINKLANYGKYKNETEEGSVAFVDIGATSINISIIKDERLAFTRMIRVGGEKIDRDIEDRLDISIKSTESIKIKEGDLLDTEGELNLVIKSSIDEILEEVLRIINFYNNKFSSRIEKLYVYGGTSKLKNLKTHVRNKMDIEVEILEVVNEIKINKNNNEDLNDYLNAIGSIIRL